jgi:GNAT superfamily N-acetyltransferase
MAMQFSAEPPIHFRQLGPHDKDAVARLAAAAFHGNPFYESALGLDARRFGLYWDEFFELSLGDPGAAVFGLEHNGELQAAVAVAFEEFPRTSRALRYLCRLYRCLGTAALVKYLRFVRAYERAMRRPAPERRVEARGLWLFVKPAAGKAGLGSRLVKYTIEAVRARGKLLVTGFFDASNRPLGRFYRRLGFTVTSPFPFLGMRAARLELWLDQMKGGDHVESEAA